MSTEKEDQNWLEALGGKGGPDKSAEIREAQALRSAMLQRIQKEEQFQISNAAYLKILEEAKKRKLLKDSKKAWNWFRLTDGSGFSIAGGGLVGPTYAKASIVLIIGLVSIIGYQTLELNKINVKNSTNEILRSPLEITLIVSEPKDIALEIEKELIEAMVPNSVSFDENQNISILIPVNSTTIKLMLNRRIELPQQEYCKIVIKRKQ